MRFYSKTTPKQSLFVSWPKLTEVVLTSLILHLQSTISAIYEFNGPLTGL